MSVTGKLQENFTISLSIGALRKILKSLKHFCPKFFIFKLNYGFKSNFIALKKKLF